MLNLKPLTKIYLATPYSDDDPAARQARFEAVNKIAGVLMTESLLVFSPISHSHPIALAGGLPTDYEFWRCWNNEFIRWCDVLAVAELDGWKFSTGVNAEMQITTKLSKPIIYLNPYTEPYNIKIHTTPERFKEIKQ